MHYVYILECSNSDLYVGCCSDLKKRAAQHLEGRVKSTKGHRPIRLVYYEAYRNKTDAIKREKQLKMHRAKQDLVEQISNCLEDRVSGGARSRSA